MQAAKDAFYGLIMGAARPSLPAPQLVVTYDPLDLYSRAQPPIICQAPALADALGEGMSAPTTEIRRPIRHCSNLTLGAQDPRSQRAGEDFKVSGSPDVALGRSRHSTDHLSLRSSAAPNAARNQACRATLRCCEGSRTQSWHERRSWVARTPSDTGCRRSGIPYH